MTPNAAPAIRLRESLESFDLEADGETILATSWDGHGTEYWNESWFGRSDEGTMAGEVEGRVILCQRTSSTNTLARKLAERGAPAWTIVIAEEQTAGRGRGKKSFHAPPGKALLISIILRITRPLDATSAPGTIPLRVGLAAARAVDHSTGARTRLKWPNDLQLDMAGEGAKIAGILCESALTASSGGFVIAGVGFNLYQDESELPTGLSQPATSIALALGEAPTRGELAGALIAELRRLENQLVEPFDEIELAELRARDPLLGHPLRVDGDLIGWGAGIAPDGTLAIHDHDGDIIQLRHGTIRLARPGEMIR